MLCFCPIRPLGGAAVICCEEVRNKSTVFYSPRNKSQQKREKEDYVCLENLEWVVWRLRSQGQTTCGLLPSGEHCVWSTLLVWQPFSLLRLCNWLDERGGGDSDASGSCQTDKDERSHPEELKPNGGSESWFGSAEGDTESSDRWSGERWVFIYYKFLRIINLYKMGMNKCFKPYYVVVSLHSKVSSLHLLYHICSMYSITVISCNHILDILFKVLWKSLCSLECIFTENNNWIITCTEIT